MLKVKEKEVKMAKVILPITILLLFFSTSFSASARVYKNEGCGHCIVYLDGLMSMLTKNGYSDVRIMDFMSDTNARKEVAAIQERFLVPLSMQGHLLVLIDDKYLFEGHVPIEHIETYLKNAKGKRGKEPGPIVVTQDSMDKPTTYQILINGKVQTCPIEASIVECSSENTSNGQTDSVSLLVTLLPFGILVAAGGFIIYSFRGK